MSNLSICKPLDDGYVMTCEGRLSFPNLFEPGKLSGKFEVTLLIPGESDVKALTGAVKAACIERWSSVPKKMKHPPLRRAEEQTTNSGDPKYPGFDGWLVIRAGTNRRPPVLGPDARPITDDDAELVYPGRWARAVVNVYTYDHPQSGRGASFGLSSVQLLRDDERIGGGGRAYTDAFDSVDVGSAAPAGAAEAAGDDNLDDLLG